MSDAYDRLHDLEREKRDLENDCRAVLRLHLLRFSLRVGDDRRAFMWWVIGMFAFHGDGKLLPATERRPERHFALY